jgi:hypothetical protein
MTAEQRQALLALLILIAGYLCYEFLPWRTQGTPEQASANTQEARPAAKPALVLDPPGKDIPRPPCPEGWSEGPSSCSTENGMTICTDDIVCRRSVPSPITPARSQP